MNTAARAAYSHVKHSKTHPKFLASNATSHRWVFGAIAEIMDNAMDPDVMASQFCIDVKRFDGEPCLIFMDNGSGATPEALHKMLGFGHSEKVAVGGHQPIGAYGNGFKSGSMRLGTDALVLTKCSESMSVGFLSQTFLKTIKATDILVPMITWNLDGKRQEEVNIDESLHAICNHSIFKTEGQLLSQLEAIPETGCIIIISGLRKYGPSYELDFDSDETDVRIAPSLGATVNYAQQRSGPDVPPPTSRFPGALLVGATWKEGARGGKLRRGWSQGGPCFGQVAARLVTGRPVPRMQVFLRMGKIRCKRMSSLLRNKSVDTYKPMSHDKVVVEIGMNTENHERKAGNELYGFMVYHRNRLIKSFLRVGCQREANEKGIGVLGVLEANHLTPTHNKQDFDDNALYRNMMIKLAELVNLYWCAHYQSEGAPLWPAELVNLYWCAHYQSEAAPLWPAELVNLYWWNHEASKSARRSQQPTRRSGTTAGIPTGVIGLPSTSGLAMDPMSGIVVPAGVPTGVPTGVVIEEDTDHEGIPDDTWAQCDDPTCLKWRKLPPGIDPETLPDTWYCSDYPGGTMDCRVPEEQYDAAAVAAANAIARKRQLEQLQREQKNLKRQKQEQEQQARIQHEREQREKEARLEREMQRVEAEKQQQEAKKREWEDLMRRRQAEEQRWREEQARWEVEKLRKAEVEKAAKAARERDQEQMRQRLELQQQQEREQWAQQQALQERLLKQRAEEAERQSREQQRQLQAALVDKERLEREQREAQISAERMADAKPAVPEVVDKSQAEASISPDAAGGGKAGAPAPGPGNDVVMERQEAPAEQPGTVDPGTTSEVPRITSTAMDPTTGAAGDTEPAAAASSHAAAGDSVPTKAASQGAAGDSSPAAAASQGVAGDSPPAAAASQGGAGDTEPAAAASQGAAGDTEPGAAGDAGPPTTAPAQEAADMTEADVAASPEAEVRHTQKPASEERLEEPASIPGDCRSDAMDTASDARPCGEGAEDSARGDVATGNDCERDVENDAGSVQKPAEGAQSAAAVPPASGKAGIAQPDESTELPFPVDMESEIVAQIDHNSQHAAILNGPPAKNSEDANVLEIDPSAVEHGLESNLRRALSLICNLVDQSEGSEGDTKELRQAIGSMDVKQLSSYNFDSLFKKLEKPHMASELGRFGC
ncbi:hypothetical protein CYMTET_14333 [Cymbomonas tetramitiformis]|uniref:CW-type domain-containing protein n=1 Tax=Cymbomonas tetramitiformis TaxID=36881 RepID=A0AAE0GGT0_9CHLO|nr:hypothetical protein CYMTET_14333 [Cymbomonas tetramitiformis]